MKWFVFTITEYSIKQNKLYGDFGGDERFDLLSVVMICLGENADLEQGTELHGLLSTILSDELTVPRKEEILQKNFGIEPYHVKEVVTSMCNLSDLIEEKGIKKGIEQGQLIMLKQLIEDGTLTLETAAEKLNLSVDEFKEALEKLK